MKIIDIPVKWKEPFGKNASGALIRTIPQTTGTAGAASQDQGFPAITAVPSGGGGIPPDIRDFNGVFNVETAWSQWMSAGGPVAWDSAFSTAIGGYPLGAIVPSATTVGLFWRSTADDNTTNPDAGGANWTIAYPQQVRAAYSNLKIIPVVGQENTQRQLTADEAIVVNPTTGQSIKLLGVNVTGVISASGANGLDTGTVAASTLYYDWLIYNLTTGTAAYLYSLSSTAPTMPSGYAHRTRLGAIFTDASSRLKRVRQLGNNAQYVVAGVGTSTPSLPIMISGTSGSMTVPTWTSVSTAAFIPATASEIRIVLLSNPAASAISPTNPVQPGAMAAPNNLYGAYNSLTNPPPLATSMFNSLGGGASGSIGFTMNMEGRFVLEGANIFYAAEAAGGLMACRGWTDNL